MSIDYETRQNRGENIENERSVNRHTHNGLDSPKVRFADIDKYVARYSLIDEFGTPIPSYQGFTANPPVPPTLSGDYSVDYLEIQTYFNEIKTYEDAVKDNLALLPSYFAVQTYLLDVLLETANRNKLTANLDVE